MLSFDHIVQLAMLVATVLGIAAVYWQIRLGVHAQAVEHDRQRRQATFDWAALAFDRQWTDASLPEFHDVMAFEKLIGDALGGSDERSLDANRRISLWLNTMEDLATGVHLGVYDPDVVERLLMTMICRGWRNLEPWIEARRTVRVQPSLYREFEELARSIWSRRRGDLPGDLRDATCFGAPERGSTI